MSWKPIDTLPELPDRMKPHLVVDLWAVDEDGNGRRWVNCYKSKWGWVYADAHPEAGGYALEAKPTHWMWPPEAPEQNDFKCPINHAGCDAFCGNYGCGG
jgi:hypothetical protein